MRCVEVGGVEAVDVSRLDDDAGLLLAPDVVLVGPGAPIFDPHEQVDLDQRPEGHAHVDAGGLEVRQRNEDARSDGDGDRRFRVSVHAVDCRLQGLADLWNEPQRCVQGESTWRQHRS